MGLYEPMSTISKNKWREFFELSEVEIMQLGLTIRNSIGKLSGGCLAYHSSSRTNPCLINVNHKIWKYPIGTYSLAKTSRVLASQ